MTLRARKQIEKAKAMLNAEGATPYDCHDGGASALFVSSSELYPSGQLTAQISDRLRGKSTAMTAAASEIMAEFANSRNR